MANDARVDELYQLPLAEFTAARNALAKSLGGAQAKEIKALAKPTVVPWAVNQLYWHDRHTYDRLMKAGGALRSAQIAALKGRAADVRAATDAHRAALANAVKSAMSLAAARGSHPAADQLARMLEALSLAASPAEQPGRFTELVQPSGFEALAGVTPAASVFKQPAAVTHQLPGGDAEAGSHDTHGARDGHGARTHVRGHKAGAPEPRRADTVDLKAIRAVEKKRAAEEQRRARARAAAEARARKTIAAAEREVDRARAALEAAEQKLARARNARIRPL